MRVVGVLIILFSIILIGVPPVLAHDGNHTEKRKMKLGMDWLWQETPVFCLFEPQETIEKSFAAYFDVVEMVKYAGEYWAYAMSQYGMNAEDWEVDFVIYQDYEYTQKVFDEYPNCDVYVHFELGESESTLGGFVKVMKRIRVIDEMVIVMSNWSIPDPEVDAVMHKTKDKVAVQQVIIHEFGHALQIGHYAPEVVLSKETHFDLMAESMMFGQVHGDFEYRSITDRDVQSLIRMYSEDGFGGQEMPFTRFLEFTTPNDKYVVWHEELKAKKTKELENIKKKKE